MEIKRCDWCLSHENMIKYHDEEWGVAVHNDQKHYEFILLDGFQAGLSWQTIINKRENFRNAFNHFDYYKIAKYDENDFERLINDAGIIRNRLKILAAITNASAFINIIKEYGSFDSFIWQFTNNKTIVNHWKSMKEIPVRTIESDKMSKTLLKRGFKFVGSTICYAYMQAAGMVNDHLTTCFRYNELK